MKINSVTLTRFRRFEKLKIVDLPPARLVVLAGPNGCGKSSLFDAFAVWHGAHSVGVNWDPKYHQREENSQGWSAHVHIDFHGSNGDQRTAFFLRSAYRNDPDFQISSLSHQGDPAASVRVTKMIDQDAGVSQNYQRLASEAFEGAFDKENESLTLKQFREATIGEISSAVQRLFPHLQLNTLGNPLEAGTFRFTKGTIAGFSYKNLSGGEKAAFDLMLDMIVKRKTFNDTVFAIDEPEAHMNTRLQGAPLGELYDLIPSGSQMWVATHSIGMMRKARDLYEANPGDVIFLDFEDHDFDAEVLLEPVKPSRAFWERALRVALDDLADLVAPREIVVCEGNPRGAVPTKNEAHDARCYETIFAEQHPDTKFISSGNSSEVAGDRLRFAAIFPHVISGVRVRRLVDRDDHGPQEVAAFRDADIYTTRRRNIESYLYDEEVLRALYEREGRIGDFADLQAARSAAIADSVSRNHPVDDMKPAARDIYVFVKRHLRLTGCGNDQMAFARQVLAPLIKPGMTVYEDLQQDIFGTI